MLLLGVDPGLDGALAFYWPRVGRLDVYDMPSVRRTAKGREIDVTALAHLIDGAPEPIGHAYLEQAWPRPGEASATACKQGAAWGIVRGVIGGAFVPMTVVSPQKWVKAMGVGKGKDASRARAAELFPRQADLFRRKRDDGRADAALIAAYAARQATEAAE